MQDSFEKFKKNKKNYIFHILKISLVVIFLISIPVSYSFYKHYQDQLFVASEKFYQNKHPYIPFTGYACEGSFIEDLLNRESWCSQFKDGVRVRSDFAVERIKQKKRIIHKKTRYYLNGRLAIYDERRFSFKGDDLYSYRNQKLDFENRYYFDSNEGVKIDTQFEKDKFYNFHPAELLLNGYQDYMEPNGDVLELVGKGFFNQGSKHGGHILMCPHTNGRKFNKGIIKNFSFYENHLPQRFRKQGVEYSISCPHEFSDPRDYLETTKLKASLIIEGKYEGFYIYYKDVPTDILRDISILTKEYLLKKIAKKNKYISAVSFPRDYFGNYKDTYISISGPFQFVGKLPASIDEDLQKLKVFRYNIDNFLSDYQFYHKFPNVENFKKNYVSFVISELDKKIRLLRLAKHTDNISKNRLPKKDNEIILTKKNNDTYSKCKGVDAKKWTNCFGTFSPQDGFLYSGEFKNGMMHGKGTLERKNISKHTGNFKNGYADGQGTISYKSGDSFKGAFKNGMAHGHGVKIYKNGQKYVGEWQQGQRNGLGVYSWKSGTQYIGEFKDSREHGQGTKTYPDGTKYTGEFQKGMPHGVVEATYKDGTKYIGNYKLNNRNGLGRFEYSDGTIFLGEWNDGVKEGSGMLIMKDGGIFMGKFKNDIANGRGLLVPPSSDALFGDWNGHQVLREINRCDYKNKESDCISVLGDKSDGRLYIGESRYRIIDGSKYNTMNGIGKMMFSSGEIFFGEFKNNIMEGFGFMFFTDGRIYFGDYFDDGQEGNGAMFFPNNEFIFGEFKNDQPVQGTMTFNNGTKYIGEYKNGRQNGFGILVRHDGLFKYEGEWKDDKRHGNGVNKYYDAERKSVGTFKGEFRENKRYKGETTLPDGTEVELDEDVFNQIVEEFTKNKSN